MSNSPRKSENKSKNWDNNKYKYKRNQSCACVQAFQRIKRPAASSQTDKISEADQREFWETRNERIYMSCCPPPPRLPLCLSPEAILMSPNIQVCYSIRRRLQTSRGIGEIPKISAEPSDTADATDDVIFERIDPAQIRQLRHSTTKKKKLLKCRYA